MFHLLALLLYLFLFSSLPNNLKLILISDSSHTRSQHNSLVKKALKVSTKSRFQKTQTLMNKLPRTIQTIPRKVHVDYQSQCAQMLVNTMNTGMFPSFLSKYGRSKFLFNLVLDERNIPASIVHRPLPCNVEFNTLRETVAFWILYLSAHPDNICMMRKVYKRKCERNEGFTDDIREKLIIEFEMRFSRIVDVGPNDLARVVKMVAAMQEENGKSETNKIVKSHIHDGQLLAEMIMKMTAAGTLPGSTLLPTPIHYTMCGQFTLYLNSAKGIDGIRCFGYAVE